MSELFSWPTVTVGMSPPCINDDPPTPGLWTGSRAVRLLVATGITVALRVARRTRRTPGRVPWSAAGTPAPDGRRPAGHRYPRAPGPTRRPGGTGQGPYGCE